MLKKIKHYLAETELRSLIKIFPVIFALHEFEEWNILSWHRKYQSNIPDVTDMHLRIIFVIIVVITFLFFFLVMRIKNTKTVAVILLPFFSLILYNGVVHLYWSVYFNSYSPGLIFGFFIGMPFIVTIISKMISQKLVSKRYVALMAGIITLMFVHVVSIGDKLESGIVNAMLLGKTITEWAGL